MKNSLAQLCIVLSLACGSTLLSAQANESLFAAGKPQAARATGGTLEVSFNTDLMRELGMVLSGPQVAQKFEMSAVRMTVDASSTLEFEPTPSSLQRFIGGSLRITESFRLSRNGKSKDFSGFSVRPLAGTERDLEVLDAEGVAWFTSDHIHHELINNKQDLSMRNMDLRLTRAAAVWLGDANLAGLALGSMEFTTPLIRLPIVQLPAACGNPNWPNKLIDAANPAAGVYRADIRLIGMSTLDYKRCSGICDGPGGAADGLVVMAPNATLKNNDTDDTADVPWQAKFSGTFPPYQNDQHPYLTWNFYRIHNTTGEIDHIGRGGVKHAFLTLNTNCQQYNCGDSHILWRACEDVYSSGNNDSTTSLGPRSEIVPSLGVWARCGSVYDTNCDGGQDSSTGLTSLSNRSLVPESLLSDAANYSYFYESWYIVREDVNIYNSMGSKQFTPSFGANGWRSTNEQAFVSGPVIDRFVSPINTPAGQQTTTVTTPNGQFKLAVKTRLLPGGNYRYDYALMNFDYSIATLDMTGNAPRMTASKALSGLRLGSDSALSNISFFSGSSTVSNWTVNETAGLVSFTAPNVASELTWASMYRFSFESPLPPVAGDASVIVAGETPISAATLIPSGAFLRNGFE